MKNNGKTHTYAYLSVSPRYILITLLEQDLTALGWWIICVISHHILMTWQQASKWLAQKFLYFG